MIQNIDYSKIDLTLPPPAKEPDRQYYFIAKCRQQVEAFAREWGRVPKACVVNYGCQMNARDSEKRGL